MKFAIIAAGEGSRLAHEGLPTPKAFAPLGHEALLPRLVQLLSAYQPESICVVTHSALASDAHWATQLRALPIELVVADTPSSMHSFAALAPHLGTSPFVLTTVDTVFLPNDFARYLAAFHTQLAAGHDGLFGVTSFIDDEKPLYVSTDEQLRITAFTDTPPTPTRYISGGIYGLTPRALPVLQQCLDSGVQRMRNFQRALLAQGLHIAAHPFGKIIDIDHVSDLRKAEAFLGITSPA